MATIDASSLSQFRPLTAAVQLLTTCRKALANIKLYKGLCKDIAAWCWTLLVIIHDSATRIEATTLFAIAAEVTALIRCVAKDFEEWASLTRLKSFAQRRQMRNQVDHLYNDFDAIVKRFDKPFNLEIERHVKTGSLCGLSYDREDRALLQKIVQSTQDMKHLSLQIHSQLLDDVMDSLQAELYNPNLQPAQVQSFRYGLWFLFDKTGKLPPCPDLTGQVEMEHTHAIHRGVHSTVFMGEWLDQIQVTLHLPRTPAKHFEHEVKIWRSFGHPNVTPVYGTVALGGDIYVVRPWIEGGTILPYLERNPTADRLRIIQDVALALEYLHFKGVAHGELRGFDIMISSDGIVRLSEFGLHQFLNDRNPLSGHSQSADASWLPPELFQNHGSWSAASDVWNFGIVSLEILTGKSPLPGTNADRIPGPSHIPSNRTPNRPGREITARGLNDDLWTLMMRCWHVVPGSRPSMTNVKERLAEIRVLSPFAGSALGAGSHRSQPQKTTPPHPGNSPLVSVEHQKNMPGQLRTDLPPPIYHPHLEYHPLCPETRMAVPQRRSLAIDSATSQSGDSVSSSSGSRRYSSASGHSSVRSFSSRPTSFGVQSHLPSPPLKGYFSQSTASSRSRSSVQVSPALKIAVNNPKPIIHFDGSGLVSSGTLEGLVERLVSNSGADTDLHYRDVLFTSCTDFTSLEDLFNILVRRFTEGSQASGCPPNTHVQENILGVMRYWLTNRHLHLDSQLLWQMKNFCLATEFIKGSSSLKSKVGDLLGLIGVRLHKEEEGPTLTLSPGRRIPRASEIMPRDLAIALTLLEGDRYKVILPTDYIAHLEKQNRANNVEAAYLTNNRIVLWVKQQVLHYDAINSRAQVLKFFINTALECRRLHNFASLTAIANALTSAPIERLRLTKKEVPQALRQALDDFDDLLDPSANHRTYRAALKEDSESEHAERDHNICIPWIAVHLRELFSTLQKYPSVVEVNGTPLINFERYTKFTGRIKEVLHFVPPDLESYRQQGQLAYLEHQLKGVYTKPNSDEELMERSLALEEEESRDYRTRKRELKRLGFKTT